MNYQEERDAEAKDYCCNDAHARKESGYDRDRRHLCWGADWCLTSSVVKGLMEAAKREVRKYGDASPELQEALKAYEDAVAQVKGEK